MKEFPETLAISGFGAGFPLGQAPKLSVNFDAILKCPEKVDIATDAAGDKNNFCVNISLA